MSGTQMFTIVGAGAIGGIVGAHLIKAGHRVHFIETNDAHVVSVREHGLRLVGTREFTTRPESIATPEQTSAPLERVLLAVKSRHTADALEFIAPRLHKTGYIISLQNGLEEYKIAAAVGEHRTVGAFLTFGGHYVEPGVVMYGGSGSFVLGEPNGVISERVKQLQGILSVLQPVEVSTNIFGLLWSKMALGAVYFATALVDADVPDIYAHATYRDVLGRLAGEVACVARAAGVDTEPVDGFDPQVFTNATWDDTAVAASWSAQNAYWLRHEQRRTGIWRDLAVHKRKTELDHLLGPVTNFATEYEVHIPYLRVLVDMVHEAERRERPFAWENLAELARRGRKLAVVKA